MSGLERCCTGWSQPGSWTVRVRRTGTVSEPGLPELVAGTAPAAAGTELVAAGIVLAAADIAPEVADIAPEAAGSYNLLAESIVVAKLVVVAGKRWVGSSLEVEVEAVPVSVGVVGEQTRGQEQPVSAREQLAEVCHTTYWAVDIVVAAGTMAVAEDEVAVEEPTGVAGELGCTPARGGGGDGGGEQVGQGASGAGAPAGCTAGRAAEPGSCSRS